MSLFTANYHLILGAALLGVGFANAILGFIEIMAHVGLIESTGDKTSYTINAGQIPHPAPPTPPASH